ncbi:MAG: SRPBCC family protein [Alphaproteobacteria bacterium]|nr:SRPBCC family protein [Alphaproteobacteria bacterium]
MKTLLKGVIALIAILLAVLVGGAYLIPEDTVVQRQIVIDAPPDAVFAVAGDLRQFNQWSPWADLDPNMIVSFGGPETGVGQEMMWMSDNPSVGQGSQTVTEYIAGRKLATELDFGAMGTAQASLSLVPVDGGTGVTWGFKARATGIIDRWLSLMFDRWIGADFEKGLAKLKMVVESEAADAN